MVKGGLLGFNDNTGKRVRILGIMGSKRSAGDCAREDSINLELLNIALKEARKSGADVELLDLRDLRIGACKECYSTCPAQCRFNEETFQCDCYPFKEDAFLHNGEFISMKEAYDNLSRKDFFRIYNSKYAFKPGDDMWMVYRAMLEADGIIFSGYTCFYSRPALLQIMFSRLCALDGGVSELWGDSKNLNNSINYARRKNVKYKQRLYGKHAAFINVSKEGDSVSPDLMKACTMMGMRIIPFSVAYHVVWYGDKTHRGDKKKAMKDNYTISMAKGIGKVMVQDVMNNSRVYGTYNSVV